MSKKVLKLTGRRPMLLALIMAVMTFALLFSGSGPVPSTTQAQQGGTNSPPSDENTNCDDPTTSLWCASSAELILKNVTISPAAPTNAPYDCIVCVCDTVSAHLQWSTVPSTNATQTCHTCDGSTPTNWCDDVVYTAGASPYNITNEWWNEWWWDWDSGIGDSVPAFSFTNAMTGWVGFDNISAEMTTNPPACGVWVHWADNAHSWRSYAFVEVSSIAPDSGMWVDDGDGNPNTDTYLVAYCPSNYVTVTASPDPGMDDKFLPSGWSMSGGLTTTNSDGSTSRTKRLVDRGTVGSVSVTATSGCSSKSVKIIVYQAKFEIYADRGDCFLDDVGHSWWNLSIQPSDVLAYVKTVGGTDLTPYLGIAGYYGNGSIYCAGDTGCPGRVIFGPQPDSSGGFHSATGSYWWCISFGGLINALTYAKDINAAPGTYYLWSNNCTTEAEEVGGLAGASVGYGGIAPCGLSDYLNGIPSPTCSCY